MKVLIENKRLLDKVSNLLSYIDKKGDLITSNFYIQATQDNLIFKATTLNVGLSFKISSVFIEKTGELLVNGAELMKIIKVLKSTEKIQFETIDDELKITQNKTKFYIKISHGDFNNLFSTIQNKKKIRFKDKTLQDGLKYILSSIDANSPKYELTGGLISIFDNKVYFISTDTKRLSLMETIEEIEGDYTNLEMILPRQAIIEIPKLFVNNNIDLFYNDEIIIVEDNEFFFFAKLINGVYPKWQRILPKQEDVQFKFQLPTKEIIHGLKTVSIADPLLKVVINSKGVYLSTLEEGSKKAETFIEYQNNQLNDEIVLGLNSRYLIDFLTQIHEETFNFEYTMSNRPILLSSNNMKIVIMPINL